MDDRNDLENCAWCFRPDATHQGSVTLKNGQELTGSFCNQEHYLLWLRWQNALLTLEEKRKTAQMVINE